MIADGDPADTTTVCGGKRLTKPSEVGYAGADTAVSGVIPPADGKFTVNCGSKTGRYLYVQLVGAQRLLWVGEIMAQFVVASSCTAGTDYECTGAVLGRQLVPGLPGQFEG